MKKRGFALAALGALALMLASPGTSSAIIIFGPSGVGYGYGFPGYGGFGYGGLGYGGLGYGGLGYGGLGYAGYGYGMPGVGYGAPSYAPGYGTAYGYPGVGTSPYSYVGYGTTYTPYRYAYSPGYRGVGYAGYGVTVPSAWAAGPNTTVAFYPPSLPRSSPALPRSAAAGAATPAAYGSDADTRATVQVEVPANATLWFDGVQTKQTGAMRTFTTPPLESGRSYHYDVKARWEENGKPVERTRRVDVYPGARVTVDFNQPAR
jgi:uncharacterized protein (TIGR03000 family)